MSREYRPEPSANAAMRAPAHLGPPESCDCDTLDMVRSALCDGRVRLAYQPVVQAQMPGRVAFYEGLIRILDPAGQVLPAGAFMSAVEASDLGRRIDCVALELGLATLRQSPTIRLSVNMSARSIGDADWLRVLKAGLNLAPDVLERLILEITESSAMSNPELVTQFMREMQDYGICFALDDFGAGYTAFRYLKEFHFDIVKIDGSFVRDRANEPGNRVLIQALVSIARHFDMFTVAECVETSEDARLMVKLGVDCLQGYYIGAPSLHPPWLIAPVRSGQTKSGQ